MKNNNYILVVKIKGGLGNQMFQYAFYKSLIELNKNVCIDLSWFEEKRNTIWKRPLVLDKAFEIDLKSPSNKIQKNLDIYINASKTSYLMKIINPRLRKITNYQFIHKYKHLFHIIQDDNKEPEAYKLYYEGLLDGYWASEKFFINIKNQIGDIFKYKKQNNKSVLLYQKIINETPNSVSLHWRRGDYVGKKAFEVITDDYMKNALKYIASKISINKVFVFTEDFIWVKKKLNSFKIGLEFVYVSENLTDTEDYHEQFLMSLCGNNIISNSSFSWWAAYLNTNKNKIVVAPNKWHNKVFKVDYKYIVPESWVTINI